jgi:hypothetical protein
MILFTVSPKQPKMRRHLPPPSFRMKSKKDYKRNKKIDSNE